MSTIWDRYKYLYCTSRARRRSFAPSFTLVTSVRRSPVVIWYQKNAKWAFASIHSLINWWVLWVTRYFWEAPCFMTSQHPVLQGLANLEIEVGRICLRPVWQADRKKIIGCGLFLIILVRVITRVSRVICYFSTNKTSHLWLRQLGFSPSMVPDRAVKIILLSDLPAMHYEYRKI